MKRVFNVMGLALLVGAASFYAWGVWPGRIAERDAVERALREYEAARGSPEVQAAVAGPRTRVWHAEMIHLAQASTKASLLQRDLLDIVTVLDLRRRYGIKDLRSLTVDQALRSGHPSSGPGRSFEIHDVVIDGEQAQARLTQKVVNRRGEIQVLEFGSGPYFTKENGRWFFESWVLEANVMNKSKPYLDEGSKAKLVEQSFDDFDPALWDAPRP